MRFKTGGRHQTSPASLRGAKEPSLFYYYSGWFLGWSYEGASLCIISCPLDMEEMEHLAFCAMHQFILSIWTNKSFPNAIMYTPPNHSLPTNSEYTLQNTHYQPCHHQFCCCPTHASNHELELTFASKLWHHNMQTQEVSKVNCALQKLLQHTSEIHSANCSKAAYFLVGAPEFLIC